jgi:uncharacterized protein YndB with AHSA1/START domain
VAGTCEVRLTRYYRAAPDEVWAALTTPESIARWLAQPAEIELRPGGAFRLQLSQLETMDGLVRAADPPRLLELDWTRGGEEPSVLRFDLRPDGQGTVLVLDHRLIDATIGMRYMSVWERRLRNLDSEVEA